MKPEELLAHADFLSALAYSLVKDEHQAADLIQDTLLKGLERQQDSIDRTKAWLATVMRNLARFAYRTEGRRRKREKAAALAEGVPSSEKIIEEEEIRRKVVNAVLDLEEPYRSVVVLRFYRNLSQKEAARRLGIPLETMRSRQKKGLALLRGRLVLDLSQVDYMDSSGVATLVEALQQCRTRQTALVLSGLQARVRSVFEIAKLDSVFTIRTDLDAALGD